MKYIKKLKIGNVELENNLILAPMAGVTNQPFRIITKKIGNYSSFSHTDIEALSNIINTHRKKSSFTFAPIIALLKKS